MNDIFDNINIEFSDEILAAADEAIRMHKHLKLTTDITFKMFFCGCTPESQECLRRYLSAIIDRNIKSVKVVNPEILPEMINGKESHLDISCTFDNGNVADIELQCTKAKDNQRNRALYYWAKLVANSLIKGENYSNMKMTYQIMILDYKEFFDNDEDDDFYTDFVMYSRKRKIILSECEKIIFIELPKLRKLLKVNFNDLTPLQFWSILLKYNNNDKIREKLHSIAKFQEDNDMADMTLDQISASRKAWALNLSREKGERDYNSAMYYAREEGLRKGLKQGEHKHAVETARRMMKNNYDDKTISEMTDLSIDEVRKLR